MDLHRHDVLPPKSRRQLTTEPFEVDQILKIGTVFEVVGSSFKAALTRGLDELSRLHQGKIYAIGRIGSLVKIHVGRRLLFGSVRALRLQTEEEATAVAALNAERRVLEGDLIGKGEWDSVQSALTFFRGLSTSALPMQDVFLLTDDETRHVYGSAEQTRQGRANACIPIGHYVGPRLVECQADIDRMFGQHCAVLGSTGSGKSSAVAAILHSVLKSNAGNREMRPRVVLIDPHGEYGQALGDRCCVYRAYNPLSRTEDGGEELRLPYWLMTSDEFRALIVGKTEFEATSQANTVYKALKHARMVAAGLIELAQEETSDTAAGRHPQDPIVRQQQHAQDVAEFDREKPTPFSLEEFERHIKWRQPYKQGSAKTRVPDGEFHRDYGSILDKLAVLRHDRRIRLLMKEHETTDPDLAQIMAQLIGPRDDKRDLRVIDILGLPNEIAGPLTAAIARLLFQYKLYQSAGERQRDPILLICEEAHRYVPNRGEAQYAAAQSAIRRLAREGRKYGLGLMLVSQRPSDVEETVLSQCNTWLVLRLTNSADQAHVARMLPDTLGALTANLSSLPRQEALFVREGAAMPARIKLQTLPQEGIPTSADVPFGAGWANAPTSLEDLRAVAGRMVGRAEA